MVYTIIFIESFNPQLTFIYIEDYSKPLSDKRIALIKLSPDEIKNEIKELSARKSKC